MAKPEVNSGSGKAIIVVILLVLFAIAILQNTQPVTLKFLIFSFTLPRAILILISTLVGVILGILISAGSSKKGKVEKR
jgi:uncharacterized integral membrane protein